MVQKHRRSNRDAKKPFVASHGNAARGFAAPCK